MFNSMNINQDETFYLNDEDSLNYLFFYIPIR